MFKSLLKPDSGIMVGVLTSIGVYEIYKTALPTATSVRNAPPHDADVESSRRAAGFKAAGLVGVVFLLSRDMNAFIISGGALVGIDYMFKHSNGINPGTGKLDVGNGGETIAPGMAQSYPLPEYSEDDDNIG